MGSTRTGKPHDAVVIGAGHNGLVAANLLADRGWSVVVLEAEEWPGGAVRSDHHRGYTHDLFSAFYPLAAASPILRSLELEQYGLRWERSPTVLAHVLDDGRAIVLSTDLDETCASLESFGAGDGERWRRIYTDWERISRPLIEALLSPFPPIRPALGLFGRLGTHETLRLARRSVLSVRRFGEEEFRGDGGPLLMAGNALHTDLAPEAPLSAFFGLLLTCLGQQVGFPVPAGGAGTLIDALVSRLVDRGGRLELGTRVARISTDGSSATGVVTADGRRLPARRAVVADVGAPQLYFELVGRERLPSRFAEDMERFQYDTATVKVDWALSEPMPWKATEASRAGTVHVADSLDALSRYNLDLVTGRIPEEPFLVVGQMTTADPRRSPSGTESLWAYTHVPQPRSKGGPFPGEWDADARDEVVARMEAKLEKVAPGFTRRVVERSVLGPHDMEDLDANLVAGAINGGTAQIYQQLIFRPVPGFARAETPIPRLFLASASAHPGGGVHGGPGSNAARAALSRHRLRRGALIGGIASLAASWAGKD